MLLLHLEYAALFGIFMLIAGLLEFPFNRSGIYEVFAMISIALLCLFPFVTTGINATSIAFHILALRQNESKVKNIVMMAISILYDVVIIAFFICFFRGLWGYSGIFFVNTTPKILRVRAGFLLYLLGNRKRILQ